MTTLESLNITAPDFLTDLHVDSKTFKLFMADTGLLITQAMKSALAAKDNLYKALILNHASSNLGMVMENAVAQALTATSHPLRFHNFSYTPSTSSREKHYELDFVILHNGDLCPIEVKSSGYKTHKSLDYFYEKYNVKSKERFVLYTKNLQKDGLVTYLPLYMAMCL